MINELYDEIQSFHISFYWKRQDW